MQQIATRIFIIASLVFGVLGIAMVVATADGGAGPQWIVEPFAISVFVILPSFAVSVAGKYLLNDR